jgi:hypothetical protein
VTSSQYNAAITRHTKTHTSISFRTAHFPSHSGHKPFPCHESPHRKRHCAVASGRQQQNIQLLQSAGYLWQASCNLQEHLHFKKLSVFVCCHSQLARLRLFLLHFNVIKLHCLLVVHMRTLQICNVCVYRNVMLMVSKEPSNFCCGN